MAFLLTVATAGGGGQFLWEFYLPQPLGITRASDPPHPFAILIFSRHFLFSISKPQWNGELRAAMNKSPIDSRIYIFIEVPIDTRASENWGDSPAYRTMGSGLKYT